MIFSPRIKQLELASLCRRLGVALESGVDVRRVFAREAGGRTSGALRQHLETISKAISDGDSLHAALEQTGSFFPQLFREMVLVGEQSGQGAEVFRQLADHYEHQVKLRRMFVSSIIWPIFDPLGSGTQLAGS